MAKTKPKPWRRCCAMLPPAYGGHRWQCDYDAVKERADRPGWGVAFCGHHARAKSVVTRDEYDRERINQGVGDV